MAVSWRRLLGTAELLVLGPEPEKLLERSREAGIVLWNVRSVDKCSLLLELSQRDLPGLEQLGEKLGYSVRIRRLSGGSEDRALLRRRRGLLLGLVLALGLLLVSSLFLWQVEVQGCGVLSQGEVLRALASCGVEPGRFRPGIDPESVKSRVLLELPSLEWLSVNISGSRATVLVREREDRPALLSERVPTELRAARAGIVRRVTVLSGRSPLEPGDAVLEGDLLISGEPERLEGKLPPEPPLGEVWAETWYEISAVCPLEMLWLQETGGGSGAFALQIGKNRWILWPSSGKGLDECDKIMHEYTLGIKGLFSTPIRLIHILRHPRTTGTAMEDREEEMKASLLHSLAERIDGEILEHRFSVGRSEGLLIVTLRARCLEDLAAGGDRIAPREEA